MTTRTLEDRWALSTDTFGAAAAWQPGWIERARSPLAAPRGRWAGFRLPRWRRALRALHRHYHTADARRARENHRERLRFHPYRPDPLGTYLNDPDRAAARRRARHFHRASCRAWRARRAALDYRAARNRQEERADPSLSRLED